MFTQKVGAGDIKLDIPERNDESHNELCESCFADDLLGPPRTAHFVQQQTARNRFCL